MIHLPSLSSLDRQGAFRIWLAVEPADLRWGFDRLAEAAQRITGQNPQSGHLFLFRGRGGSRLKILYWDKDGYALWYKRLEVGTFRFPKPARAGRAMELRVSELAMLLDGIDLRSIKRLPRYAGKMAAK